MVHRKAVGLLGETGKVDSRGKLNFTNEGSILQIDRFKK